MQSKAATVEQYLAELPADRRTEIETVRKMILANLGEGYEEGMQYGMIGYYVPHHIFPNGYHCDPSQPLPYMGLASQKQNMAVYEFMVPLVKGWSTEMSIDVASTGVQIHGGIGFIEETGAAQHYRDAKILTIYEGTTAIQANDLVGRKTARDGGRTARAIAAQIEAICRPA